jgi:hypothetical protein
VFDLHDVFQECNPGIKQELPVLPEQKHHCNIAQVLVVIEIIYSY